jgi:manganese/zinc/iron transport system substrate-binding protein
MHRLRLLLPLLAAAIVGCDSAQTRTDGKVHVVTTTGMIADMVRQVGGEDVSVEALMGPGVDPHRYTPTPGDLAKLSEAKLVLTNGLHLEGKMADVLHKRKNAAAVTRGLAPSDIRKADDDAEDPHVWFDPVLWAKCVDVVRDELAKVDPTHADGYAKRAADYQAAILAEHDKLMKLVESLPKNRRILVTSHDAFGYFGARYGFQVRGLQGVSTAAETSLKDRQELAQFLGQNRIPAVFTETSVPPTGLQSVLETVKSQYKHGVKLVGGDDALYSDALGSAGSSGETYLGMIRHNVTVIVDSLK